jgi:hypothetical protein
VIIVPPSSPSPLQGVMVMMGNDAKAADEVAALED